MTNKKIILAAWFVVISGFCYIAFTTAVLRERAIALILAGFFISHMLAHVDKRYLSLKDSISFSKESGRNWWLPAIGILIAMFGYILLNMVSDVGFAEKSLGILLVVYLYFETLLVSKENESTYRAMKKTQKSA